MKKIVFALALAFIFGCSSSQQSGQGSGTQKEPKVTDTTMELYYPNGRVMSRGEIKKVEGKAVKHGAWTVFYDTGEKGKEGAYKDDKMDGPWTQYYKSGAVSVKMNYLEGKLNGPVENFFENGGRKSEEQYALDRVDGIKKTYHSNGTIESEAGYAGGRKQGPEKLYFPDEKLKSETNWLYDKKHGTSITYHKDGSTVSVSATYDNGSLKGPWFANYANGARKMQGQYVPAPKTEEPANPSAKEVEGYKTGPWTFFYDTGKKAEEGSYVNNGRQGKWRTYAKEGHLYSEGSYEKNSQVGIWNYYAAGGQMEKKLTLTGGLPNGKGWLYENGKLVFEGNFTGLAHNLIKNGPAREYYPGGALKSEGDYMMNRKNGPYREYHSNGKLMASGNYMNDKRNEAWTFYKEDGVTKDTEKSGYYMMGTKNDTFSSPGKFQFKPSFK
ncbi:MAG: toxin-antitoxin system YwqK family antitoxin [Spirochaetes bacterium]|nr:toxin-antitoxin system YwqK family antitoxin [Spirochaetota bacterium]